MIEIKMNTAKGKKYLAIANSCKCRTLEELYKKPSDNKRLALYECTRLCYNENGFKLRRGNANSFSFTATWFVEKDGHICRRVRTRQNDFLIIP